MRKFQALFFLLIVANSSICVAADEKFVDCGPGYMVSSAKNRDGIQTVECKKIWCMDLENGKSMGSGSTAANGYVSTTGPAQVCDPHDAGDCIECFGKRKWCPAETNGEFNPEFGMYTKGGIDSNIYRGVLAGNCYKWQMQDHGCGPNEVAVNNGTSWTCLKQGAGTGGRSAIKSRAVRRTSTMKILK
jgi:hypothetical protein